MRPAATRPSGRIGAGIRVVRSGLLVNLALALVKGVAGMVGHSFALVADAIESLGDILSSLVVWSGLKVAALDPDRDHPWGHGKAEPIAAAVVGLMLWVAALGITIKAIQSMTVRSEPPRAWTLAVLAVVVLVKETLFRKVGRVAEEIGSGAVAADAWHHRSDAISSSAVFLGVSLAVLGGPRWQWADEAAAIAAAIVITFTGWKVIRPATYELMDGAPDAQLLGAARVAASGVAGVLLVEKLMARKVGERYYIDLHVQADPEMSLYDAHVVSGMVKSAIRDAIPVVENVLVHMEPYEAGRDDSVPTG